VDSKVNLTQELAALNERWTPRAVAALNDYAVKVVKLQGEFVWHSHSETDELFLVLEGRLVIQLRNGDVHLNAGDLFVVPRGIEHRPAAENEAHVLLIEPAGTVNTGD
jgi:mannose-6-phosphate isomerase-like protein (cupin superfamily)